MYPKLIIAFPKSNAAKRLARLRFLLSKFKGNPYFKEPFPAGYASIEELEAGLTELEKADFEAKGMDRDRCAYRNKLEKELTKKFQKLARHFEVLADGDVEALKSTGFELAKPPGMRKNKKIALLDPPPVQLKRGNTIGSVLIKWKKILGACIEAHSTCSDPTVEANWGQHGLFSGAQAELTGFAIGQFIFLRFRVVNEAGAGAWSDPYRFMPT